MSDQKENEFGFEEDDGSEGSDEFVVEDLSAAESEAPAADDAPADFAELSDEFIEPEDARPELQPAGSPERKSSMMKLLLVVLLLVIVAGGLFFFLGMPDEPEMATTLPVQTKKQPIAIPVSPKPAPVAPPQAEPAPAAKPVEPVVTEAIAPTPAPAAAPVEKPAQEPASSPPAVSVASPAPAPQTPPSIQAPAATEAAPPMGEYLVNAGAFMLSSSLKDAEARIAKLDLPVQLETTSKVVPMTRLQLGVYAKDEADSRLAELLKAAPGAFKLPVDGQYAVFAGSYSSLDKARRFADLLYEKGIRVSEVQAEVPVPLTQVKVGPFISRAAADTAVKQLQDAGLEGQVVRVKKTP